MKKLVSLLAMVLALSLALPALSLAEAAQESQDLVLFSVDGEEYLFSQVEAETEFLVSGGYLEDYDYRMAIEYMIQNHVIDKMIQVWELNTFTAEEDEAFLAEAQVMWNEAVEYYIPYFLTEDTEAGREQARLITEYQLMSQGYNLDMLSEQLKNAAVEEKLMARILEGRDVSVTEEEIRKVFEETAAQDQLMYEGNVSMYEMYTSYYGQESWYTPEGFRGVTHILLEVDEELLKTYFDLQVALEEGIDTKTADTAAVTQADVDAARQAILDSRKEDIDAIYQWLANGETFENLIALYGTDPGMQDPAMLQTGYAVHRESVMWDPAFVEGAYDEKMQKPGDVSDPVVGSYGIHIVYYLRDIPAGFVEMTDVIAQQIEAYLQNQKTTPIISEVLAQWTEECVVVYYEENINAALGLTAAE